MSKISELLWKASQWKELSSKEQIALKDEIMSLPISLSNRESLFFRTDDYEWLKITTPLDFRFCGIMILYLPEESDFREQAKETIISMIPLAKGKYRGGMQFNLKVLRIMFKENPEFPEIWSEISRISEDFSDWAQTYEETGDRRALNEMIYRRHNHLRKLHRLCRPEDREYMSKFL